MKTLGKRFASELAIALLGAGIVVGLAGAKPARADGSWNPYYIGIGVDSETRENAVDRAGPYTKFDEGIGESIQFGRHLNRSISIEAEANNFVNSDDKEFVPAAVGTPLQNGQGAWGNINLQSYMFNVVGNIRIKSDPKIEPFLSAGIGVYQSQVHGLSSPFLNSALGFVLDTDSDWQTAYQFKAGVGYKADKNTTLFVDVRRFLGDRFELESSNNVITGGIGQLHVNGPRVTAIDLGVRFAL
jgi:opacity protein-like surface antigen